MHPKIGEQPGASCWASMLDWIFRARTGGGQRGKWHLPSTANYKAGPDLQAAPSGGGDGAFGVLASWRSGALGFWGPAGG